LRGRGGDRGINLNARLLNFGRGEEDGVFDQAAEFFFADVVMRALAGGEILEGLVFHLQSLEMNDLKIKFAFIPNLALLQFHGRQDARREDELVEFASAGHPLPQAGEKDGSSALFECGLFGGDFLFSFLVGAVGHGLFLGRHFLIRFWGFITHDVLAFDFELTGRRHESFSAGDGMVPAGNGIVNDATILPGGWWCAKTPARKTVYGHKRVAEGAEVGGRRVQTRVGFDL
jgi:hypothetical protein